MSSSIQKNSNDIFIMKPTNSAEFALKKWLSDREFNNFSAGWKDKKGNDGVGLIEEFGNPKNPRIKKCGVIICLDGSVSKTIEIVENHLGYGEKDEA